MNVYLKSASLNFFLEVTYLDIFNTYLFTLSTDWKTNPYCQLFYGQLKGINEKNEKWIYNPG